MTLTYDDIQLGSISSATMRLRDIVPAYEALADELEVPDRHPANRPTDADIEAETEAACEYLTELADAINDHLPEHIYVGTHEGDGADHGVWLDHEGWMEQIDTDLDRRNQVTMTPMMELAVSRYMEDRHPILTTPTKARIWLLNKSGMVV